MASAIGYSPCNANARKLFSKPGADIIGYTPAELMSESVIKTLYPSIERCIRDCASWSGDVLVKDALGKELAMFATVAPRGAPNGRFEGAVAILIDLTERNKAEEALRDSEERYRLLVEVSPDGILIHQDGIVTFANAAAMQLLGAATSEEVVGSPIRSFVHPDSAPLVEERLGQLAGGAALPRSEQRWIGVDGVYRTLEVVSRSLAGNGVARILTIFRDVSERHDLESKLRQAQKMEALGRLAGGIAHDFNNLLGVMMSYTGILLAELPAADPIRADLSEVQEAIDRAAALTSQLLAFGRQQTRHPARVNICEAIRSDERLLRRIIGEDIDLCMSFETDRMPAVLVDVTQLEQILLNLAGNARDAMPRGGALGIRVENAEVTSDEAAVHQVVAGPYVRLSMSDTGTGIDADTLTNMFDPFFTTKVMGKGTGLGLATVYGIVSQSGGFLTVDTKVGSGTTFHVLLPLASTVDPVDEAAGEDSLPERPARDIVILLVEDEESLRRVTERVLTLGGYSVVTASRPSEALAMIEAGLRFDCLVTDVVMPGMSGQEMARDIRRIYSNMPILLLSGYAREVVEGRGTLDSTIQLIQKPVKPAHLLSVVSSLVKPARRPSNPGFRTTTISATLGIQDSASEPR